MHLSPEANWGGRGRKFATSADFDALLQKSARCLEQVFGQRAADVAGFVATEYSFEGWVACEWAAACRRSGFVVSPEPRYARAKATAIAEGSERGSSRELRRFLLFAQASNAEVEAQAIIAGDLGCLAQATSQQLVDQSRRVGRMLGRFIIALEGSG